jgi:hypothetical protein
MAGRKAEGADVPCRSGAALDAQGLTAFNVLRHSSSCMATSGGELTWIYCAHPRTE